MASKKIALIESDASHSQRLAADLGAKGFTVVETQDGKSAVDLVSRERPDLVVLAVELAAGQSGYIVCGKLKKDDELKKIPVVIIGKDAEGFEAHKRLKARAEDYLRKPFEAPALLEKIGSLIGLPEPEEAAEPDEALNLAAEGEDEPLLAEPIEPEPDSGEATDETRLKDDPDLDALDAAFETISDKEKPDRGSEAIDTLTNASALQESADDVAETSVFEVMPETVPEPGAETYDPSPATDEADAALGALDEPAPEQGFASLEPLEEADASLAEEPTLGGALRPAPAVAAEDVEELRSLRERCGEAEGRVRELEDELTARSNELEALKGTHGGRDKEVSALREQSTRKDKENLKLKQDLNEKEAEIVGLREKENALEQKVEEMTTELAKSQAQVKTLGQRTEGGAADRKKLEQSLTQAKDETRQMGARLAAAQRDLEQARQAGAETKHALDEAHQQAASLSGQVQAGLTALASAKSELEAKLAKADEESAGLRARVTEMDDQRAKNEERVVKAYQKIKSDEKVREKTKKALAVALQLLEEPGAEAVEVPDDQIEEVA